MAKEEHGGGQDMDIMKVRELVKLVEESGIEELEISHLDTTIRIQKSAAHAYAAPAMMPAPPSHAAPAMMPAPPSHAVHPAVAPGAAAAGEAPAPTEAELTRGKWKDVRSPIVGTFYRSPAPTSPAFVNVGDHVAAGETLCIVEAMKVMNEIEAEFGGTIKEILMEDGSPVEAEAALFLVDPD